MLERRPIFLLPSGAALVLVLTTGCATEAVVQAGAAVPMVSGAHPAVALDAAVGIGLGDDDQGYGFESRIRGKFGSDITGTSLNTGFFSRAAVATRKYSSSLGAWEFRSSARPTPNNGPPSTSGPPTYNSASGTRSVVVPPP